MGRIEKTVFISYRRTNLPWALAIYQNLTASGYDVFFDYQSINSGDFEQVILANIRARAHFLVLLTPSALERCENPGDWLRREIETALDEKRNIVPLFFEGFDFGSPSIAKYLTGKLALLKNYNGMNVPADYFVEAMGRLQSRYLNVALDAVLHPLSNTVQKAVQVQQLAASQATSIKEEELTAQEWFEKGYKNGEAQNYVDAIHCYTEAIRLKPDYAEAYNNRGIALYAKSDLNGAIQDYTRSIELKNPELHLPYNNRGLACHAKGDLDGAIQDYTQAVRLKPDYSDAYYNRGLARYGNGDLDGAIQDYIQAIRLKPDYVDAYYNRGLARHGKSDLDLAIKDYSEAIRLKPDFANAYWGRGNAWSDKDDHYSAAADYQKYFDIGGTDERVRKYLRDAKKKIK